MTTAKIVKYGDGYALVLSKEMVDSLAYDTEMELNVFHAGRDILISPHDDNKQTRFDDIYNSIDRRYEKAFKRLAE